MKPRVTLRRAIDGTPVWVCMVPHDMIENVGFMAGLGPTVDVAYKEWLKAREQAQHIALAARGEIRRRFKHWEPVLRKGFH